MPDVMIDEIATDMEITDAAAPAQDMRRLMNELMQQLKLEAEAEDMRQHDGRIYDRSWRSDVKPE